MVLRSRDLYHATDVSRAMPLIDRATHSTLSSLVYKEMYLESIHIHLSATNNSILPRLFHCDKNILSNMRSQIVLALLATAISAAPVVITGDAKVCFLFRYNLLCLMPLC